VARLGRRWTVVRAVGVKSAGAGSLVRPVVLIP